MNPIQVRTAIRKTVLAAILSIIAITLEPYVSQFLGGPPAVQMPGGPRTDEGVSQQLDDTFLTLDDQGRQHFIVQFSRELTARELSAISADLQLRLDGPGRMLKPMKNGSIPPCFIHQKNMVCPDTRGHLKKIPKCSGWQAGY